MLPCKPTEKYRFFLSPKKVDKTPLIMQTALELSSQPDTKLIVVSLGGFDEVQNYTLAQFCQENNIKHIYFKNLAKFPHGVKQIKKYDIVLVDTVSRKPCEAELIFDISFYIWMSKQVSASFVLVTQEPRSFVEQTCFGDLPITQIIYQDYKDK